MKKGKNYVKMNRDSLFFDVLKKSHDAFILWSVIAFRASVFGNPIEGLKPGEAMVGDHEEYGMTRQRYRTALKNLERWGIIKQNPTTKGTVVTLMDTRLFDINEQEPNHQPTTSQPPPNHQPTTIKKENKETTLVRSEADAENWWKSFVLKHYRKGRTTAKQKILKKVRTMDDEKLKLVEEAILAYMSRKQHAEDRYILQTGTFFNDLDSMIELRGVTTPENRGSNNGKSPEPTRRALKNFNDIPDVEPIGLWMGDDE